jgi:MoaA/NifB/PqqE/SkfB family radical SAM enzyme
MAEMHRKGTLMQYHPDGDLAGIRKRQVFQGPEHVVIDLTNRCNAGCVACWTYAPTLEKQARPPASWYSQELSIESVKALIEDLKELGCQRVRFTGGGEPFLHPDILKAIQLVKESGMQLSITSNGLQFDEKILSSLLSVGAGELSLSLWAATGKTWKALHPSKSEKDFWRIVNMARDLKFHCPDFQLSILNVVSSLNVDEIDSLYDLSCAIGADSLYLTLVDSMPGTEFLLLDSSQKQNAKERVERIKMRSETLERRLKLDGVDGFLRRLQSQDSSGNYDSEAVEKIPCYMGWYFSRVLANGEVCPCCRGVDYPMGNLNETSFLKIWASEAYKKFRQMGLDESKSHEYFKIMNCSRMCDNLMHNQMIEERLAGFDEIKQESVPSMKPLQEL